MLQRLFVLAVLLGGAMLVQAQAPTVPAPFIGSWKVSWQGKAKPLSGEMVLTESGGHWQTFNVASGTNACYGKEVPIGVQSASPDAVTLQLKFSEVINGCGSITVKLQRGADGAVTGTRSGEPLTLVKQ